MSKGRGRPKVVNEEELIEKLEEYIDKSDYPILTEFTSDKKFGCPCSRKTVYELAQNNDALSDTLKRLNEKRETILEKGVVAGDITPAFAIFRLKQPCHAWTDKPKVELEKTRLENELLQAKIDLIEQSKKENSTVTDIIKALENI